MSAFDPKRTWPIHCHDAPKGNLFRAALMRKSAGTGSTEVHNDPHGGQMRLSLVFGICCAVAFGTQVYRVAADEVPTYDVQKTCKTDTQAYQGPGTATLGSNTASGCVADEQTARATLVSQWTQFATDSKSECMQVVGNVAVGLQSYVELLTCLQMAKDVKSLPK